MEFEFDEIYQVKIGKVTYTVLKHNNHWRVQWRRHGLTTYRSSVRHEKLEDAKNHVRTIALDKPEMGTEV